MQLPCLRGSLGLGRPLGRANGLRKRFQFTWGPMWGRGLGPRRIQGAPGPGDGGQGSGGARAGGALIACWATPRTLTPSFFFGPRRPPSLVCSGAPPSAPPGVPSRQAAGTLCLWFLSASLLHRNKSADLPLRGCNLLRQRSHLLLERGHTFLDEGVLQPVHMRVSAHGQKGDATCDGCEMGNRESIA